MDDVETKPGSASTFIDKVEEAGRQWPPLRETKVRWADLCVDAEFQVLSHGNSV